MKTSSFLFQQRGFSLIEVLVTLVLVAISLLGLLATQARSVAWQTDSLNRRTAAELMVQFRERLSSNFEGYAQNIELTSGNLYQGSLVPGVSIPSITACAAPCAVSNVTRRELNMWMNEVNRVLPAPFAVFGPTVSGEPFSMTVTIGWFEPEASSIDTNCSNGGFPGTFGEDDKKKYRCLSATMYPG